MVRKIIFLLSIFLLFTAFRFGDTFYFKNVDIRENIQEGSDDYTNIDFLDCRISKTSYNDEVKKVALGDSRKTNRIQPSQINPDIPTEVPSIGKKSQVIDRAQYIIYIPRGINPKKKYPLVIGFSPSANTESIMKTWKYIADKRKCIILASKEFRNGIDMQPIFLKLVPILKWAFLNLPIDTSKVIATGFSGGGMGAHAFSFWYPRLVSAVIVNTGMMHEFFIQRKYMYPRGKLAVFLASPTGFRYEEMKQDKTFLESLNWKIKWIEFEGGHVIAPNSVYDAAVKWLKKHL